MSRVATRIGPSDHGRRMSLDEFDSAEGEPGGHYELSRGVITVTNVPNRRHFAQVNEVRKQLSVYEATHPGQIHAISAGTDCKILLADLDSERHPDWAVYKTPMPAHRDLWSVWTPALVVEVVSPESGHRDYVEKPEEYFRFGVGEYWVVDESRQEMLVHRRERGRWALQVVRPGDVYRSALFPGLAFDLAPVFEAAQAAGD